MNAADISNLLRGLAVNLQSLAQTIDSSARQIEEGLTIKERREAMSHIVGGLREALRVGKSISGVLYLLSRK